MTKTSSASSQSGFGHVLAVALVAVVLGMVAFIGYSLYGTPDETVSDTATTAPQTATELTAPNVNSASDLDKATSVLDQVDPSSSNEGDQAALETQLNGF